MMLFEITYVMLKQKILKIKNIEDKISDTANLVTNSGLNIKINEAKVKHLILLT